MTTLAEVSTNTNAQNGALNSVDKIMGKPTMDVVSKGAAEADPLGELESAGSLSALDKVIEKAQVDVKAIAERVNFSVEGRLAPITQSAQREVKGKEVADIAEKILETKMDRLTEVDVTRLKIVIETAKGAAKK